jgi:hypothetical protein
VKRLDGSPDSFRCRSRAREGERLAADPRSERVVGSSGPGSRERAPGEDRQEACPEVRSCSAMARAEAP